MKIYSFNEIDEMILENFDEPRWVNYEDIKSDCATDGFDGLAHEIWAAAQLLPDEGIEDGVARIKNILYRDYIKKP